MEYYRRCNVCGKINCYTDSDIQNNNHQKMVSGLAALGSLTNSFIGTKYDMYEMNKISDNAYNKIVNYEKCTNCGSIDTLLVTKKYAQFTSKNKDKYEINVLNENAKLCFEKKDYDNAFCFASIACIENEEFLDTTSFLSLYNLKSIEELKNIIIDCFDNQHFLNLFNHLNQELKNNLLNIYNINNKELIKKKIKEIVKLNLDEIDIKEIRKIKQILEDNDLKNEKEYKILDNYLESKENKQKNKVTLILIIIVIIIFIAALSSNKGNQKYGAINATAATVSISYGN